MSRLPSCAWVLIGAICLAAVGCQQQMAIQPAPRPDQASSFFPNGQSMRPLVPGTVARGHLHAGLPVFSGVQANESEVQAEAGAVGAAAGGRPMEALALLAGREQQVLDAFPFPVTKAVLEHGRNRYMIYCVACHDTLGTGHGKIVERGYTPPPSYHIDSLRNAPVGHFFAVMTYGYGSMPDYRQQVPPRDRWAIAAYIRVLQASQHFPEKDLPPDLRKQLDQEDSDQHGGHQP